MNNELTKTEVAVIEDALMTAGFRKSSGRWTRRGKFGSVTACALTGLRIGRGNGSTEPTVSELLAWVAA